MGIGSNWIKCDLHIHTPFSMFQNYGDKNQDQTWEDFISDIEALPEDFQIIGINDYLTIEGYKKVLGFKKAGRLAKIKCILPVVEFRINQFVGKEAFNRINWHVIFSDKVNADIIQDQFINAIKAGYTLNSGEADPDWHAIPTEQSFIELGNKLKTSSPEDNTIQNESSLRLGFNNFNIDYEKMKGVLQQPQFRNKCLTAIGKAEWSSFRWDGGGAAVKKTLINEADFIFQSCRNKDNYDKSKKQLFDEKVNHLLLDCSDAHYPSSSKEKDRIGNCHTWTKIEPSFEGLRQILFEPETRLHISETHPDIKNKYQVIDYVAFRDGGKYFASTKIPLSSYLNTIIGGKSTGKSLLAGLIVKSSDRAEFLKKTRDLNSSKLDWISEKAPSVDFVVRWKNEIETCLSDDETRKVVPRLILWVQS